MKLTQNHATLTFSETKHSHREHPLIVTKRNPKRPTPKGATMYASHCIFGNYYIFAFISLASGVCFLRSSIIPFSSSINSTSFESAAGLGSDNHGSMVRKKKVQKKITRIVAYYFQLRTKLCNQILPSSGTTITKMLHTKR